MLFPLFIYSIVVNKGLHVLKTNPETTMMMSILFLCPKNTQESFCIFKNNSKEFWCARWVDYFLLLAFIKPLKIGLDRFKLWDYWARGIIFARLTLFLNSPPPEERKQSTIIWLAGSGQSNKLSTQAKPEETKYSKKIKFIFQKTDLWISKAANIEGLLWIFYDT